MIWLEHRPGVTTLRSLSQLDDAFKSPDLRGDRRISIEAKPHISEDMEVWMVAREGEAINRCWDNLPGAFVPMFLLCQSTEGMKWEDLVLARDVIAPSSRSTDNHRFSADRSPGWMDCFVARCRRYCSTISSSRSASTRRRLAIQLRSPPTTLKHRQVPWRTRPSPTRRAA